MRQFKDNAGRTWTVDINVHACAWGLRASTSGVIEGTLIEVPSATPCSCATWSGAVCARADAAGSPTRSSARRWRATRSRPRRTRGAG